MADPVFDQTARSALSSIMRTGTDALQPNHLEAMKFCRSTDFKCEPLVRILMFTALVPHPVSLPKAICPSLTPDIGLIVTCFPDRLICIRNARTSGFDDTES